MMYLLLLSHTHTKLSPQKMPLPDSFSKSGVDVIFVKSVSALYWSLAMPFKFVVVILRYLTPRIDKSDGTAL